MTRALIVDDNADNRYMLRALLTGHGYVVDEARHGAEALAMARQQPPDVTVSDLLMPVMDGYTLLRHWKADAGLKAVPIIVYTATYTGPKDERLALDLGADAFLIKPAEPEAMMACIGEVMERTRDAAQPTREPQAGPDALLADYGEVLVRKLEEKALLLEQSNRELRAEITIRTCSEEALLLRDRAIQAVSQGILICDPRLTDNPIVYASAGFERITGYRADEVLGRNCRFLQCAGTDPATVAELRAAIAARRGCSVTILNRCKDGRTFWNELTITPVLNPDGQPTHFVGVQSDVTERRQIEERLRQSQKLEAFGQLAGGVAHDFNNLLTIISGYASIVLAKLAPTDPMRRQVLAIADAGERATTLTRQLLAFSRKSVLDLQVLDLNATVSETETMLRRLIGEDIVLGTVLSPGLSPVRVDAGQLSQALMNLVVNARDAMPQGGRLTIETAMAVIDADYAATHVEARPGTYIRLAVSDTGSGIAPEAKARLFEPFFTTKAVGKGTGLGLAVVHGMVKQCGGFIEVYSEVGIGTTFKLYLPATIEPAGAARPVPSPSPAPTGTETILLAEDEDDVRRLAALALEQHGYVVLTASNGHEALALAERHHGRFALLLTDVVMPGMGGGELSGLVRTRFPQTKILFMSGYTDDAVVRHGILQEQVAFLHKPFTPGDLARKVRSVLDG